MGREIIFIGDSLIEFYDWQGRFREHRVQNLGVAGETVQWLLDRLPRVLEKADKPDLVFVMTGINNVAMEDTGFLSAYEEVVETLLKSIPNAMIFVQSLLPTRIPWVREEAIESLNHALRDIAEKYDRVWYLDVHAQFLSEGVDHCLLEDGVHVSTRGYEVWSEAVEHAIATHGMGKG